MKEIQIITLDGSINTQQQNVDLISLYAWIIEHETQIMSQRIKYGKKKPCLMNKLSNFQKNIVTQQQAKTAAVT
ncbi:MULTISPECIES: hypothetical protein [Bacillus]|uniref:hypothetical protein n=1 Tax=Bacillus TaxID=1386 RepID=UPI000D776B45|nr:hypothetical protein [Bacillus subtilis]MBU8845157.1 hypothetical protein [Alkalicoccobacillus gibsonii]AWM19942.1 hypothetical protein DJ572_03265 [Bacillus subtilis]MDI6590847.1 hypothetical protein [Bacillus subtilis]MDM5459441.1 hypothetical protein [Bacillus subtilis]MDY7217732.1 hypothetical protein [Bacillus subtilis]